MDSSFEHDNSRSEAPSTCDHWTDEEEIIEVGDVAILENVQTNVECGVVAYDATLVTDCAPMEVVESTATVVVENNIQDNIQEEIEVEYEEMSQDEQPQVTPMASFEVTSKEVRLRLIGYSGETPSIRKSTRKRWAKKNAHTSDILEIVDVRDAQDHKYGSDFLVRNGDSLSWIYEDDLSKTDRGCEAMEMLDPKKRRPIRKKRRSRK